MNMNTNDETANILADLENQFGAELANISERKRETIPEGTYTFKCVNAFLNRSKSASKRKQLSMLCEVIAAEDPASEAIGKKYTKNWGLETTTNIEWLKGDLINLELIPPTKPQEFVDLCNALMNIIFDAQLVQQDPAYPPNMYINEGARRHDLEDGATQDIPF